MIVFLYGTDGYRLKQALNSFVNRYKAKYSGVSLFFFDGSDRKIDQLDNALKNSTFFDEHKLVVCKNIFTEKMIANKLGEYILKYNITGLPDITLLAIEELSESELLKKDKNLFKALAAKNNHVQLIEPLIGLKLQEWIKEEFINRDCTITNPALAKLIQLTGTDSWSLINEIEKLCNYKRGEIHPADINTMIQPQIDLNIFDLVDAVAYKKRSRAVELLYQEMRTGRDPYYILTMIVYQFRNILALKDQADMRVSAPKTFGIHPFVIKKSIEQGQKFSLEELKNIYKKLLHLELNFKRGLTDPSDGLYDLIINI